MILRRASRGLRAGWLRARLSRAREAGYAAVMVAIVVPTLGIGCAAVAVDVGSWYATLERVQKAADAAALGGVPFLPQDFASARDRAYEITKRNGYDKDAADTTVTVALGEKATQLKVTISTRVVNQFGSMIGISGQTLTRSATADYQGPAPMGSPCLTFGNEPDPGHLSGSAKNLNGNANGYGSTQSGTTLGYCPRVPFFWATVEGPETGKVQGDRYQTLRCENTGVDGCSGTTNDEYDGFGYVFLVKVQPESVGKLIDVQLFDPMMVNTSSNCALLTTTSTYDENARNNPNGGVNPYVEWIDAQSRYTSNAPSNSAYGGSANYCTGDSYPGAGSGANPPRGMTTSFVLRQQTDSQNPTVADVVNDSTGSKCISQYGTYSAGKNTAIDPNLLNSNTGGSTYNDDVAATFHNWISFCKFTPTRAGDYYLQVRTNVSMDGVSRTPVTGTQRNLIKRGNTGAANTEGNTTQGEGSNSFAIRATTVSGNEQYVSVSGYNHMPIYINSTAATANFYLIRVLPGAAGQKISFSYFDAGDAASDGSVTVLTPSDATGSITTTPFPGGCTAYGGSAGGSQSSQTTLSNCTAPFTRSNNVSQNNGKTETITIPVPADYNCSYTVNSGCWYKVRVAFGSGSVTDVTTWDATVVGDPVRIVK